MKLHRMSQDNKYFLFEDTFKRCFKLYTLIDTTKSILGSNAMFSLFNKQKTE